MSPNSLAVTQPRVARRGGAVRLAPGAFAPTWGWIALGVAAAMWIASLFAISPDDLGPWGLLPALPLLWYGAVLVAGTVCLLGVARRGPPRHGLLTAGLGLLIVILYGTTAFIEGGPRFAWTYKHVAVTQYVMAYGSVDPSTDIYQRWPGSFALGAYLSELMGVSDPAVIATWAQVFYALVLALLVYACARIFSKSPRAAWIAAIVFSCTNWTGQLYYAPQPLALVMHLTILLLILRFLRCPPNAFGRRIQGLVGRHAVDDDLPADTPAQSSSTRPFVIGTVLALQLASTVTHQLTPYVTIASVLSLVVLGYVRSRWLVVSLLVITVGYLIPNLQYVQDNYALFNGINPFANFRARSEGVTQQLDVKLFIGRLAPILSLLFAALALTGMITRWRRGGHWPAVVCGALIATPLAIGFVQNYGGEAQLRAFLFASPWCAIAIGWLLAGALERRRSLRPAFATGAVFSAFLLLFVPNFFGNEDVYFVPQTEVQACQWLSQNSPAGAVYVQSVPGFPARCSADYSDHVGPSRGDTPSLLSAGKAFGATDFQRDVPASMIAVYEKTRAYGKNSVLIFSTSQQRYARAWGLFDGAAGYERMQQAVAASGMFELIFNNADTQIYSLSTATQP